MRLSFELDPAIIHHIIYSQAGSIGKAIIELIMNSVDANAKTVTLSMTKEGFICRDDGAGFATREDVLRYFGRFGTPHEEGDATYGRFRLGRGQIMAHASTEWRSRRWQMTVDTRAMGYSYDLDDLPAGAAVQGCEIIGRWYEPLTDTELLSATQEIRDLVRYTPVAVELNGRVITRDPRAEQWDHEDEFAWYRVKVEGAVSIYNQGVLIRHDSSHQWGAGGLVVSKKAIALNVSRTEILRKTCPVWKPIAQQFGAMAREISAKLGAHRKTEASRGKHAHDLLSGSENLLDVFEKGEVITLLPGKRHLSLYSFLDLNARMHGGQVSLVENAFDIPKAESIAREKIAQIIHPDTLARFNCQSQEDFRDTLERVVLVVSERYEVLAQQEARFRYWAQQTKRINVPVFIDFETLRAAFVERTTIVLEKDVLDRETRRMWTALRWCLEQYAGLCAGGQKTRNRGSHYLHGDEYRRHILLGESNTMEAWTDGETYIAFNANIVKRLRAEPIKTAGYLFSVAEHEVAHQGDSVDCGHDEAFYQRYHDISIKMAAERQRYLHLFMQKYTYSMEGEGNRDRSKIWYENMLLERANTGREKRDLPPVIEDQTVLPFFNIPVEPENQALIKIVNAGLVENGACPPPPDWDAVRREAQQIQEVRSQQQREWQAQQATEQARQNAEEEAFWNQLEQQAKERVGQILGVALTDIPERAWPWLLDPMPAFDLDEDQVVHAWEDKAWERPEAPVSRAEDDIQADDDRDYPTPEDLAAEHEAYLADSREDAKLENDPRTHLKAEFHHLVELGETWWSLERNAAAAGFGWVPDYLAWRAESVA